MKTITGLVLTGVLAISASPAAAQTRDWQRDLDHLIDSALVLAAHALDDVADARLQSSADRERVQQERERQRQAMQRAREQARDRANDRGPEYTEVFAKTVKIGRSGRLEVDGFSGDIQVTGSGGDDLRLTATKRVRAGSEQSGRDTLRATEIAVTERPSGVSIKAEATRGRFSNVEVDYVLTVPTGTELVLTTFSGDLTVKNVNGDMRLKTTSGDVALSDLKSRDISVVTISGDVTFERVDAERLDVNVTSGDIDYRGKLAKNGRYELNSNSGDIHVVPDTTGFDVEAGTFNGEFSSDFPLKIEGGGAGSGKSFGTGRGRGIPGLPGTRGRVRGTFNDGGASLSLRTFTGDITIAKK